MTTEFDKEWIKFIKKKILRIDKCRRHTKDEEGNPMASSDWRDKYDIYSTPVVYC